MKKEICPFCGQEMKLIGDIESPINNDHRSATDMYQLVYECSNCGNVAWDNNFGFKKNYPIIGMKKF